MATETTTPAAASVDLERLSDAVRGPVVAPDDEGCDAAGRLRGGATSGRARLTFLGDFVREYVGGFGVLVSAHRRGRDRVMTTRSFRWIGPLAAIVGLVALAPAAEAATTARAKPKCVWPGRDCHPPARLWYRVSASLKADQQVNDDVPPSNASTGHEQRYTWAQEWKLESKHAVRLTLMCTQVAPREQFIDSARIDGRRRKIGGCAPRRPASRFTPSARFAAAADGQVTHHEQTLTLGPFENADTSRCLDRQVTTLRLVSAQPLVGSISVPGSNSVGVLISAEPTAPLATVHRSVPARQCFDAHGNPIPTAFGPGEFELTFGPEYMLGETPTEGFFSEGTWFALYQLIRFPTRAANFGRRYVIEKTLDQPELEIPMPPAPPRLVAVPAQKEFTYTIRLEPCPNRGLAVKHC